ncbi:hypothetical protein KAI92_01605 [Candidatus Parcubacteria bacterium]|nr:hypothetical protein [Candidatus Parcubacteria bacterium]
MKKLLLISILFFVVVLTGCESNNQNLNVENEKEDNKLLTDDQKVKDTEDTEDTKDVADVEEKVEDDEDEKKAEAIADEEEEKDEDSDEEEETKVAVSDTITITNIEKDETLISPALIEGEADIDSGFVIVELRKIDHSLTSDSVEAIVKDGKFKISKFWFEFKNTKEGFVAVYDKENPKNLVEIPVKFQTVE